MCCHGGTFHPPPLRASSPDSRQFALRCRAANAGRNWHRVSDTQCQKCGNSISNERGQRALVKSTHLRSKLMVTSKAAVPPKADRDGSQGQRQPSPPSRICHRRWHTGTAAQASCDNHAAWDECRRNCEATECPHRSCLRSMRRPLAPANRRKGVMPLCRHAPRAES